MKFLELIARLPAATVVALVATMSLIQAEPAKDYEPTVGQEGKDVVWVPTQQALVDKMLDTAKVTPKDYVIDLGSGDGRTVITAAKRGARALGVEYNPDMVNLARRKAKEAGVEGKARFLNGDIFKTDFSKATVVTLFLLPDINLRLRPKILDMKPGTRIVSNSFDMGDWQPDTKITITDDCTRFCNAMYWVVPAKVQGTWRMPRGRLVLEQKYQMLTGTLNEGKTSTPISDAKMTGDQIEFSAGDVKYSGKVTGRSMQGTMKSASASGETKWRATRTR